MTNTRAAGPPRLTLELRMAFSLASQPGQARWTPQPKPVRGATVRVQATGTQAVSNRLGRVTLALPEGADQVLEIEPAADELSPGVASPQHAGGGFAQAPSFLFRPFQVVVSVGPTGFVHQPAPRIELTPVPGAPAHALIFSTSASELVLDWKPDWLKSGNRAQVTNKSNEFLVIHRTGGDSIGSAVNTFTNPANVTGIHYLLDVDGHVVKLVHEADRVNHTGPAFWQGAAQVNARSIGIEVVHGGSGPFPDAQYESLLRLVREIRTAHPSITRQRVVGHSDIAVASATDRTLSNRRIDDPGGTFDWVRLEQAQQARQRVVGPPAPMIYNLAPGEFVDPGGRLSQSRNVVDIAQIQRDLSTIGYSVATDGTTISGIFDAPLQAAVRAFHRRYFSGAQAAHAGPDFRASPPRIDYSTAFAIQSVVADTLP